MTDLNEYAVSSGSMSGELIMVRLDDSGNICEEPFEFADYDPIDKGIVEFEITGFQKRFEAPRPAQFMKPDPKTGRMPDPMVLKTRLEFTIINGPQAGKRWLGMYTWAVGETSNLGQLLRALLQQSVPRNWNMTGVIGLCGKGYVKHSLDKEGKVKFDRDGNPYADISIDTVEPITTEPLPESLQPAKPSEQRAAKKERVISLTDPSISWTAFWEFAKSYGFNDAESIEKKFKIDTDPMGVEDLYNFLSEKVGHKAA